MLKAKAEVGRANSGFNFSYAIILWQIMQRIEPFKGWKSQQWNLHETAATSISFADEPVDGVIREAVKCGTAVPKTPLPPPDTPGRFIILMKNCYSFAPGKRPLFSGKNCIVNSRKKVLYST